MEKIFERVRQLVSDGILPEEAAKMALQALVNEYDSLIHVNRAADLAYPDFVKEPLYANLEKTGPTELDVSKLEQWLHPKQGTSVVVANDIHEMLKAENLLDGCLGLHELLAIQAKGIGFFRKHFQGKAVFGWRGVVRSRAGDLNVPSLFGSGDEVVLFWHWLGRDFSSGSPALRRAS